MRLLLRERDDGGYAQGVVLPVAAGCRPQVPSRGQPGRWPISGLLRWRPEGLPLVCAPLRFWSVENSKFLSNFTVNVRAIGLGHVRLVCCAVRVGLDRVGGATGDRLEGTCLRGRPVGTGQSLLTARTGWRYRLGFSDAPRLRRQRSRSRPLPSTRNLWRRVLRRRSSPSAADLRPWPVAGCADSRWLVRWQSCVVILIACRCPWQVHGRDDADRLWDCLPGLCGYPPCH
jgi:hypothetical protein